MYFLLYVVELYVLSMRLLMSVFYYIIANRIGYFVIKVWVLSNSLPLFYSYFETHLSCCARATFSFLVFDVITPLPSHPPNTLSPSHELNYPLHPIKHFHLLSNNPHFAILCSNFKCFRRFKVTSVCPRIDYGLVKLILLLK